MKKEKYSVAVVGATGLVGQEILSILEERNFPVGELKLLASERSVGTELEFNGESYKVEVLAEDSESMIKEARVKASWAPNATIKIPATADGLQAISVLSKENIAVNMTLCFSLNQAMLGALAGTTYVSPFVGRLDDAGHDGMQVVKDIVDVFKYYEFRTKVIAASIRHPQHCLAAAEAGAHIATVPYSVLMQMIRHPLTDIGIARFLADWRRVSQ